MTISRFGSHISYARLGFYLLLAIVLLICYLLLKLDWVNMPLSANVKGTSIEVGPFPLKILCGGCLLAAFLALFYRPTLSLMLFAVPLILALVWPIALSSPNKNIMPTLYEEARARLVIERVFRLQNQDNVNRQPTYSAIYDAQNMIVKTQSIFSNVNFGWYIFVFVLLVIPLTVRSLAVKRRHIGYYYLFSFSIVCITLSFYYQRDPQKFNQIHSDANAAAKYIQSCENRLVKYPSLAHSDSLIQQCATAYNQITGDNGPFSHINTINEIMGGANFASLSSGKFAQLELLLIPIVQSQPQSHLDTAFKLYGQRQFRYLQNLRALREIEEQNYSVAISMLNNSLATHEDPAGFTLLGYSEAALGQLDNAKRSFSKVQQLVANQTIIANVHCTLADAYVEQKNFVAARALYSQCMELDSEQNYWAVSGLGGT